MYFRLKSIPIYPDRRVIGISYNDHYNQDKEKLHNLNVRVDFILEFFLSAYVPTVVLHGGLSNMNHFIYSTNTM